MGFSSRGMSHMSVEEWPGELKCVGTAAVELA